ncbi:MAG TPA: thioesterase domain-containing protein, partial [Gemmatimonadaceae bacterium]|nr:thioesterase domain-containing protein [Gemmatimonadaceae bacterium]
VRSDGALEFVGRVDDTVKIRGFRIELREVERVIAERGGVRQAVVLAHESGSGASLVGFVTPARVDVSALLTAARDSLPAYMVPGSVVALDTLPLTPSGKVDRRALLALYTTRGAETSETFESDTERAVAQVWRAVLGHAGFGRDSNFFEIGGSSLEVFAVVFRLAEQLSLPEGALTELAVYRNPVLAALAAQIDAIREGRASDVRSADDLLVTLRRGNGPPAPPLFVIASAGGTLGAYTKLVKALHTDREVIGVRDPFLWGDRDATLGFDHWVARYVDAMAARQPTGAFHIAAYSSAGAFGYEAARRLRAAGREVGLLALIDPLALDRGSKWRFGYWALEARFKRRPVARALSAMRLPRRLVGALIRRGARESSGLAMTNDALERFAVGARTNPNYIRGLSALLELNTGRPFRLGAAEVERAGPDGCLQLLLDRVRAVSPETDPSMIEKLVVQYELQVRSQHAYRLRPYDGVVHLFEPEGPFRGMEAAQLAPYVGSLRSVGLPVGAASGPSVLDGIFPDRIRDHYLSMRDDAFVAGLAGELDRLLDGRG